MVGMLAGYRSGVNEILSNTESYALLSSWTLIQDDIIPNPTKNSLRNSEAKEKAS